MYFKIQGTCFKICALYFLRKTISDFQRLTKPQKFGFSTQMRAKKIIRNGMYTSPQTVHRFRRADGFYTHAACVSKAPECHCKNTV